MVAPQATQSHLRGDFVAAAPPSRARLRGPLKPRAAHAAHSRRSFAVDGSVRAASLVAVLLVAKALGLAGRDLPDSWWAFTGYIWHDVAVGAAFWVVDVALRRRRFMWLPYFAIAAYAALNVPVTRALSSPLTVPMWRAAGGPLMDSIVHYLTISNIAAMAAVLATSIAAPPVLRRAPRLLRGGLAVAAAAILASGPFAVARLDTLGLHRNAITAVLATLTPRVAARAYRGDVRASPFADGAGEDLSRRGGTAAGMNVVLIVLESTGAQYLSIYGAADDPTPRLSALARQSIVFEHAYAAYPESIKGLFAVLCSRTPTFDTDAEAHAKQPCAPLTSALATAGYRTALFHSGRFGYLGMEAVLRQQRFDETFDAGAIGGKMQSSFGVDEPATVSRMLSWIDALGAGQRFFITYMPTAGHHPYVSPEPGPFNDSTELAAYKNALHYGDRALGAFMDGLQSRGRGDRTLYVVYGDHGEAFGQHDGNYGHSIFIFDENVRIPLIVHTPTGTTGTTGTRVRRVASVIDIAPTILDLLGLPAAPLHEGASLLKPRERMALFFTDYAIGWLGLRDGCWKAIVEVESRRSRLFDVCRDPRETADLSREQADRADAYRERLEAWGGYRSR